MKELVSLDDMYLRTDVVCPSFARSKRGDCKKPIGPFYGFHIAGVLDASTFDRQGVRL